MSTVIANETRLSIRTTQYRSRPFFRLFFAACTTRCSDVPSLRANDFARDLGEVRAIADLVRFSARCLFRTSRGARSDWALSSERGKLREDARATPHVRRLHRSARSSVSSCSTRAVASPNRREVRAGRRATRSGRSWSRWSRPAGAGRHRCFFRKRRMPRLHLLRLREWQGGARDLRNRARVPRRLHAGLWKWRHGNARNRRSRRGGAAAPGPRVGAAAAAPAWTARERQQHGKRRQRGNRRQLRHRRRRRERGRFERRQRRRRRGHRLTVTSRFCRARPSA